MRKILLILVMICMCGIANAQCIPEILNVYEDPTDISKHPNDRRIIVETKYTLNGVVVQEAGRNRFLNTSGDNSSIVEQAERGAKIHCENLVGRIDKNSEFIAIEKDNILNGLKIGRTSQTVIDEIKDDLIGVKSEVKEKVVIFKGKKIKVTYDKKNTVSLITDIVSE